MRLKFGAILKQNQDPLQSLRLVQEHFEKICFSWMLFWNSDLVPVVHFSSEYAGGYSFSSIWRTRIITCQDEKLKNKLQTNKTPQKISRLFVRKDFDYHPYSFLLFKSMCGL